MVKAVGVRQFRAHLSEYLRLVKAGETILVTDHDEVVAEFRPARANGKSTNGHSGLLQGLADAGVLTLPLLPKAGWTWQPSGLGLEPDAAARILDEVRGER